MQRTKLCVGVHCLKLLIPELRGIGVIYMVWTPLLGHFGYVEAEVLIGNDVAGGVQPFESLQVRHNVSLVQVQGQLGYQTALSETHC